MTALMPEDDRQAEQIEWLRGRLDTAYGTDPNHWVAARLLVMSGAMAEVVEMTRTETLAPLLDPSDFLAEVIAADVWASYRRPHGWMDLGRVTREVQRSNARRYLEALREFISR